MQAVLTIEVPGGMRVRVDEAGKHGAIAEIDDARAGRERPARNDSRDATAPHDDVDVRADATAAVEHCSRSQYDRNRGVLGQQRPGEHHDGREHQLAWVDVLVNCAVGRRPNRYSISAARSVCIVSVVRSTRSFGPCDPLPMAPSPSSPSINGATNEMSPAPRRPGSSAATAP